MRSCAAFRRVGSRFAFFPQSSPSSPSFPPPLPSHYLLLRLLSPSSLQFRGVIEPCTVWESLGDSNYRAVCTGVKIPGLFIIVDVTTFIGLENGRVASVCFSVFFFLFFFFVLFSFFVWSWCCGEYSFDCVILLLFLLSLSLLPVFLHLLHRLSSFNDWLRSSFTQLVTTVDQGGLKSHYNMTIIHHYPSKPDPKVFTIPSSCPRPSPKSFSLS